MKYMPVVALVVGVGIYSSLGAFGEETDILVFGQDATASFEQVGDTIPDRCPCQKPKPRPRAGESRIDYEEIEEAVPSEDMQQKEVVEGMGNQKEIISEEDIEIIDVDRCGCSRPRPRPGQRAESRD